MTKPASSPGDGLDDGLDDGLSDGSRDGSGDGSGDGRGRAPRYRAVADGIERDLACGRLRPGQRLPTHRALARELGVTVGTVTRAYREAARRGLVRGEVGRGTFAVGAPSAPGAFGLASEPEGGRCELGVNLPPPLPDSAPFARGLTELARREDLRELFGFQPHVGAARHRAAGARWLARLGLALAPERVLVCAGSQNALLVALTALAQVGDLVLCEELTFPGFLAAAELRRLRVEGLACDPAGVLPDALEAACRRQRAAALYLVPTLHNPTGRVMPAARRAELAAVAARHGLPIVEDDPYGFLLEQPPAAVASHDPELHLAIGGTTKALAPALRIAYLAAPERLVDALADAVRATTFCASTLGAELASRWIEGEGADEILALRRAEAAARRAIARAWLGPFAPPEPPGGTHLWLPLPAGWTAEAFVARARERRVELVPPRVFHVGRGPVPRAVRLCLGAPPTHAELERGLAVLRDLLARGPGSSRAVV